MTVPQDPPRERRGGKEPTSFSLSRPVRAWLAARKTAMKEELDRTVTYNEVFESMIRILEES